MREIEDNDVYIVPWADLVLTVICSLAVLMNAGFIRLLTAKLITVPAAHVLQGGTKVILSWPTLSIFLLQFRLTPPWMQTIAVRL